MDKETSALIVVVVVILLTGSLLLTIFKSAQCNAKGQSFESAEWGIVQGCMVKHKGKWLPLENIRGFDYRD